MITRHYSREQRRALNMIWNAAGRYDADPPFMAFTQNGHADFYFNTIIGLSMKYLDQDTMNRFFLSYSNAPKAADYDAVVWLALESFLYQMEIGSRPMLKHLRESYARDFLAQRQTLSRQQMMTHNMKVYTQQEVRWDDVLGKKEPFLSPADKSLKQMLEMNETDIDQDVIVRSEAVVDHLQDVLIKGFHFSNFNMNAERAPFMASGPLKDLLDRTMHHEVHHVDSLLTRNDIGDTDSRENAAGGSVFDKHDSARSDEDLDYIRACFGECIYTEKEMHLLENDLCRDAHEFCSLWITKGKPAGGRMKIKEAKLVDAQSQQQRQRNVAYFEKSNMMMQASIRKLSAELDTILSTFMQALPDKSRNGKLLSSQAYRLPLLNDPYVFEHPGDEVESDLSVDLLLDASASRMKSQEIIASQAYILAKSLEHCHIPVRVTAFHSLRGYTVLQILKDYKSHDCSSIFRYSAAGWNRDGLAIRTAGRLMRKGGVDSRRILLVMTDANPDDSTKMPPVKGSPFTRDYANIEAVKDTADAVKQLRDEKIAVGAVYLGPGSHIGNVTEIYGTHYVRVQKVQQLAMGISSLLQKMLVEMKN